MTASLSLQTLIYETLRDDLAVKALVVGRVYDRVPAPNGVIAPSTYPYISFGPSDYVPDDADCIVGGTHTMQIDAWSRAVGYPECKNICDAVKRALHKRPLNFGAASPDAVVDINVESVRTIRDSDGITSHGIITISAMVEEG